MTTDKNANGRKLAAFITGMRTRELPPEVLDAARMCLADWLGVALGAHDEDAGRVVRETAAGWKSQGKSTVIFGKGNAAAPFAALANGTLAHCLDFDDTYVKAITHTSAPVWAATLALGEETGATESEMLAAYITGFETACRAGYGMGEAVTARGWHSTGVFGRIGAAAASAALLKLNEEQTLHALGAAATQTAGLTASFGTMAKPFHAGKAAMDGVLSAQLAAGGFHAATNLLEPGGGLDGAVVQDKSARIQPADFSGWEILNNSFKPYASCHLTHPAIDAARSMAKQLNDGEVKSIRADVGALALQVTGEKSGAPATPLEGKFDMKYCIALALRGRTLSAADFREPWRRDEAALAYASKVYVHAASDMGFASARVTVERANGEILIEEVAVAKGHPGNPLTWDDMWAKFSGLNEDRLGARTRGLFDAVRGFGNGSALTAIRANAV